MKRLTLAIVMYICAPLLCFAQEMQSDRVTFNPTRDLFATVDDTINGACQPTCRAVKLPFATRIEGFNAKSGETFCSVGYKGGGGVPQAQNYHANTYNPNCVNATNTQIEFGNGELLSEGVSYGDIAQVLHAHDNTITLSHFLASVATLDPEIIDMSATNRTGILTLKNPGTLYGTNIIDYNTNPRIVATSDAFNKANLGFFAGLFVNMSEIYGYVQNLLFVLIGMFFIGRIGFDKGLKVLEKAENIGGGATALGLAVSQFQS